MVDLSKFEDGLMFSPLQKTLLNVLEKNGPLTRSDLVKQLDSPRTTIYDNLTRLQNHNLIRKFSRSYKFPWKTVSIFQIN